ncbi:hypothetical protein GCM10010455_19540 [Microbacterium esteraromaticum]
MTHASDTVQVPADASVAGSRDGREDLVVAPRNRSEVALLRAPEREYDPAV